MTQMDAYEKHEAGETGIIFFTTKKQLGIAATQKYTLTTKSTKIHKKGEFLSTDDTDGRR